MTKLRIGKQHKDTLADMVLVHRVAMRNNDSTAQTITQRALDCVFETDPSVQQADVTHLRWWAKRGNEDAQVALIRLEKLGIIENLIFGEW